MSGLHIWIKDPSCIFRNHQEKNTPRSSPFVASLPWCQSVMIWTRHPPHASWGELCTKVTLVHESWEPHSAAPLPLCESQIQAGTLLHFSCCCRSALPAIVGACPWCCGGSQSISRCAWVTVPLQSCGMFCLSEPWRAVFPEPLFMLNHLLCYLPEGNYSFSSQMKNIIAIKIIRDLEHPSVYRVTCHSDRHNINS